MREIEQWSVDDQRRVDDFTREALASLRNGDPHLLFVAAHAFVQAAGMAMRQDIEARPQSERLLYYLGMATALHAHIDALAVVVAPVVSEATH